MTAYNIISPLLMQNGQPEDISIPKANFDAIAAVINGGLDDSNIAAGANIQMSKIAPGGTWGGVTFNQGNMTLPGYIHGVGDIYAQYGNAPVVGIGALGPASQAAIKFGGDTTLYRNAAGELTINILHATNLQDRSEKAVAGGYASLDGQAHVPVAQLPDISSTYQVVSQKGQPNGYASLGANGLVPGSQLPPGLDPAQVQTRSEKGQPNGYAGLDASAKVPVAQLPDISTVYQVTSQKGQANGYAGLNASGVVPLTQLDLSTMQARSEKAQASGYASLDSGGKVPAAQLPPIGADLIYNGDWASGPYTDGQIVVYNNVAYMCTAPTTNPPSAWPGGPPGASPNYVIAYGTTLPAVPSDGQEAVLVDNVSNPTWEVRYRYNATSSRGDKWEYQSGAYYGLTPPVTPRHGDEWVCVDSATNPTYQWRFKYNAGNTTAYKWELVGGTAWTQILSDTIAPATGWFGCQPQFAAPRAGIYRATSEVFYWTGGVGNYAQGPGVGGQASPGVGANTSQAASGAVPFGPATDVLTCTASQLMNMYGYTNVASTSLQARRLTIQPLRVS